MDFKYRLKKRKKATFKHIFHLLTRCGPVIRCFWALATWCDSTWRIRCPLLLEAASCAWNSRSCKHTNIHRLPDAWSWISSGFWDETQRGLATTKRRRRTFKPLNTFCCLKRRAPLDIISSELWSFFQTVGTILHYLPIILFTVCFVFCLSKLSSHCLCLYWEQPLACRTSCLALRQFAIIYSVSQHSLWCWQEITRMLAGFPNPFLYTIFVSCSLVLIFFCFRSHFPCLTWEK